MNQLRGLQDREDGTYVITWVPRAPGDYEISVSFKGTFGGVAGPVRGSPVISTFQKGQPAENNSMFGPTMLEEMKANLTSVLQFVTQVTQFSTPTSSATGLVPNEIGSIHLSLRMFHSMLASMTGVIDCRVDHD